MTEGVRRRQTLHQIQSRLMSLGNSNWNRWSMFSTEQNLSIDMFCSRINALGFEVSAQDMVTLWRAVGITKNEMDYNEFIRFMQANVSQNSQKSLNDLFGTDTRIVLNKFIDADQSVSGYVSFRAFTEICNYFSIPKSEILDLSSKYDEENTGYVKYFKLLADLSYSKEEIPTPKFNAPNLVIPKSDYNDESFNEYSSSPSARNRRQNYDSQENSSPYRGYSPDRRSQTYSADYSPDRKSYDYSPERRSFDYSPSAQNYSSPLPAQSPSSPGGRRLDPSIFGQYSPRSPPTPLSPSVGGRGKLDPAIFGQYSPKSPSSPSSGGRGRLDPSIFGEKPVILYSEQEKFNADECPNCEQIRGLSPDELLSFISKQVSKYFKGGKSAFSRWRGGGDYLDVESLRNGLARDANVLIPRRDLEAVLDRYGGELNLSSFVRMLSDGSSVPETRRGGGRRSNDPAIQRIADQVKGDAWEDVVIRARSAEEMCRGFNYIGMSVSENDVQTLMQKLGRSGFINAIRACLE